MTHLHLNPRLLKPLVGTGLAAVLVGCGGGGGNERSDAPEFVPPKATANKALASPVYAATYRQEELDEDEELDRLNAAYEDALRRYEDALLAYEAALLAYEAVPAYVKGFFYAEVLSTYEAAEVALNA